LIPPSPLPKASTNLEQDVNLPLIQREIVLGRNSKVWRGLARHSKLQRKKFIAIGHAELADFNFEYNDRVWVFSYSREEQENEALLSKLVQVKVAEVVYVSSSSVKVAAKTNCYEYPRVKLKAEQVALSNPVAKILTIGLVYNLESELPAGENIATCIDDLASFMVSPNWSGELPRTKHLFKAVSRSFSGALEKLAYDLYGKLIFACASYPCALRPVDLLLLMLRMRWYGYVYLSNQLWISTTSL
jgi:hypothetical protein